VTVNDQKEIVRLGQASEWLVRLRNEPDSEEQLHSLVALAATRIPRMSKRLGVSKRSGVSSTKRTRRVPRLTRC